jgi:hypothetical protein
MRIFASLPVLLLLSGVHASAPAQIYKCREAGGSILYSDAACGDDAETVAVMARGSIRFQPVYLWDPMVEEDLAILSAQEQELVKQLHDAQIAPGQPLNETTEAFALRRQILVLLKSVRRQKTALLGRGVSPEDGEELIPDPEK